MSAFINRYATPLTTGLFAVAAISGVALFFRWTPNVFRSMHEWLSMVLLVPFTLHIWKNWRTLMGYVKLRTLWVPLIASAVVALPFAISGMASSGGNPAFRAVPLLTQAPLTDLAPVLKTTPEALLATLKQRGYPAESTAQTLNAIAAASGTPAAQVLFAVMPAGR